MNDIVPLRRELDQIPFSQLEISWDPYFGRIHQTTGLLPRETLEHVIAVADTRPTKEQATTAAGIILGQYAKQSLHDPKVFTQSLVKLLGEFPAAIVSEAMIDIPRSCPSWLSIGDANKRLKALAAPLYHAKMIAEKQLNQLNVEDKEPPETKGDIADMVGSLARRLRQKKGVI